MNDKLPGPGPTVLRRRASRRALLAGGAAVAAAGATAAVAAFARGDGSAGPATPATPAPATSNTTLGQGPTTAGASGSTAAAATGPIADPLRRAAHLLRRAGFGGSRAEIEAFAKLSRDEAADRLVNFESIDNSALDARLKRMNLNLSHPGQPGGGRGALIVDMQRWWLARMAYTARPLEERMTYIWHGLLTSQISKVGGKQAKLLVTQNELFRAHALGRYDDLLLAVSKDPAMLTYLDTVESVKEHPNENYARELMELFSMGAGNYTESDVREGARAFTGWRITPPARPAKPVEGLSQEEREKILDQVIADWEPRFFVNPRQHDAGKKTFLGRTGTFDGDDIVRIIMEQPATGRFICRRLFTEFVSYEPTDADVDALVKTWDGSGHSIKDVVRAILVSDAFYSEAAYRALVRSPIEFIVGAIRGLEIDTDIRPQSNLAVRGKNGPYAAMGQVLFEPPSVAGWPGGETWLSSGTFFARLNFADQMLTTARGASPVPALAKATTPEAVVDAALASLVDGNVAPGTRDALVAFAGTVKNPAQRAAAVAYLVLGSPEYQLA